MDKITREEYLQTKGGQAFIALATNHSCGQCKKTFDHPWVVPTDLPYPNNLKPNGKIAFHWQDTHGFPHEMFYNMIMNRIFDFSPAS